MTIPNRTGGAGANSIDHVPDNSVRDHVACILRSSGFAKSERLKRFLTYAIERSLAGDSQSLKEYSIALEVFDRSQDYNPKIDAVVRVEARRLRSRLEQYYATEGINDSLRIQFPLGTYVPVILWNASPVPETRSQSHRTRRWLLLGSLVVFGLAIFLSRLPFRSQTPVAMIRLIRDSTAAFDPAVSRDGRLLAYASDQSGNVDIWLRSLDSAEARRLTSDSARDTSPDFSPDSKQVLFRSDRAGGGVYVVSSESGKERLVAPFGRSPKFSPDGKWIAYWTGQEHHFQGEIFIAQAIGGTPIRVGADLADAKWPVWAPDGKALLVYGSRAPARAGGAVASPSDLYLVPVRGGPARETGWTDLLRRSGLFPDGQVAWDGSILQFSAATSPVTDFDKLTQSASNLWEIRLPESPGRAEGKPQRITFGAATEQSPSLVPGGDTIFASRQYSVSAFESLVDQNGRPHAPVRAIFSAPGSYVMPRISRDGSTLIALSDRSGQVDIWAKNLRNGGERVVTSTNAIERGPQISSDGKAVVFGIRERSTYPTYEVNLQDGASRMICADCGSLSDLSPDSEHVLFHAGEPWSAYSLNLRTGQKTLILSHGGRIYASSFSPDGKWLTFHADNGDDEMPRRIYVAPFVPDQRIPETQWISITDGPESEFDASWSADGAMLFFVSDRDGNRCIWGRRVNPQNKRPIGDVFAVTHLHQMNAHIPDSLGVSISAASGRLVFGAIDLSSTLYRAERPR